MQFFDTHAHIGLIYNDPIEQLRVLQEARKANVTRIVSICNSLHDFGKVYNNLKSLPYVYHAVGVAPSEVVNPGKDWIQTIEASVKLPNVVAIGETGLDYFKKYGDKTSQIELFITQLELAEKYNLPVIIHNREAGKDVLDRERRTGQQLVVHAYLAYLVFQYHYLRSALLQGYVFCQLHKQRGLAGAKKAPKYYYLH